MVDQLEAIVPNQSSAKKMWRVTRKNLENAFQSKNKQAMFKAVMKTFTSDCLYTPIGFNLSSGNFSALNGYLLHVI
tara:strand:+ start:831 stop:1058 length:228 start_codon:yes stop_codon:yes gene_type:complete